MRRLLVAMPLLLLSLPAAAATVSATGAWFRYLLPQIPAGGFVTLTNAGNMPAVLTGVTSAACGMAMLHRSEARSGTDIMVGVRNVTIPAHGSFRFSPGGYHIMCMQPKMTVGGTVPVTLLFKAAPALTVPFEVYGADGKPAR
ncbi:MAG: copper chaperone PCu(A)C [Acidiphilium sp.]